MLSVRGFMVLTLAGLSACLGPRVFTRLPPAESVRIELQNVKTYKVNIEFAEGTPPRARKFLEDLTGNILQACEIPVGSEGEISISMRTKAYWGTYQSRGRQASGAEVMGTLRFRKPGQPAVYQREFHGRVIEPAVINKSYPNEDHAPYDEAALLADSYAEVLLGMIHEIYGPGPLIKALSQGKPFAAANASAMVLGDFASEEAFVALRNHALNSKGAPQIRAVRGLGRFGQERAGAAVLEVLQKTTDDYVTAAAVLALGELVYRPAAPELLKLFKNREDDEVRDAAGYALTRITGLDRERGNHDASIRRYEAWVKENFPGASL